MKKFLKTALLASAFSLALAIPACSENVVYKDRYIKVTEKVETEVETIEDSVPAYKWERQASYGENPDIDVVIDGQMTAGEGWEEKSFYSLSTSQTPYVKCDIATMFSDGGLYVYAQAADGAGIVWSGRNYFYKNTNFTFYIAPSTLTSYVGSQVKIIRIDSNNVYPGNVRLKAATRTAKGTSVSDPDTLAAEFYVTWEELGLSARPESIKILPKYNYMYSSTDAQVTELAAPFTLGVNNLENYLSFGSEGYLNADGENAKIGNSGSGIAKTDKWDISHEGDAVPYVTTTSKTSQAIFFNSKFDKSYAFETEVDVSGCGSDTGTAGLVCYLSNRAYLTFVVAKESTTVASNGKFTSLTGRLKTVFGGKTTNLEFAPVSASGNAKIKIINVGDKLFFILGNQLVYCETNRNMAENMSLGLFSSGLSGVKFSNYSAEGGTKQDLQKKAFEYAYSLSATVNKNAVSASFSTEAVDKDSNANSATLYLKQTRAITLNSTQIGALSSGSGNEYDKAVEDLSRRLFNVETVKKTVSVVNGDNIEESTVDMTDEFTSSVRRGEYALSHITGDTEYAFTFVNPEIENLAVLTFTVYDALLSEPAKVACSATVMSDTNGKLSYYAISGRNGKIAVLVEKGYTYEIEINADGHRTRTISVPTVTGNGAADPDSVAGEKATLLQPTVLGSTARCADPDKSTFSVTSSNSAWDYSRENEGVALFVTDKFINAYNNAIAYYSGYTVDRFQVAEFTVKNNTVASNYDRAESDPAVGFCVTTQRGNAFMGLRMGGIRYLKNTASWSGVEQVECGFGQTVNLVNDKPFAGTWSFKMVRIDNECFFYAHKNSEAYKYVAHITLDKSRSSGYAAIGVGITVAWGLSLEFTDYSIQVGYEAVEPYLADFGAKLNYDASCYSSGERLVDINGSVKFSDKEALFEGSSATVKLNPSLKSSDGSIYTVKIGSQEINISADQAGEAIPFRLDRNNLGSVAVSLSKSASCAVSGTIEIDPEAARTLGLSSAQALASLVAEAKEKGSDISLPVSLSATDTDFRYSFTSSVKANSEYAISAHSDILLGPAANITTATEPLSGLTITLVRSKVGGTLKVGSRTFASTADSETLGYDSEEFGVSGPYLEVYKNYDNYHYFNDKAYGDFVLKFTFSRYDLGTANELDPAVGVSLDRGSGKEKVMFIKTGVRILPINTDFNSRVEMNGISPVDFRSYDGSKYDCVIMRRGNTFYMYSKRASVEDYTLVYIYESKTDLGVCPVSLIVTAQPAKYVHCVFSNVSMTDLGTERIAPVATTLTVNCGEGGSCEIAGGHEDAEGKFFIVGDEAVVTFVPDAGKVVSSVKVNGGVADFSRPITLRMDKDTTVDVEFEDAFDTFDVSGSVTIAGGAKPAKADITFVYLATGTKYSFTDVALSDGNFDVGVRAGQFDVYVRAAGYTGLQHSVTVSDSGAVSGSLDFTLDIFDKGAAIVGGKSVNNVEFDDTYLYSDGAMRVPDRLGNTLMTFLPASVGNSDAFAFTTTITMSGGSETHLNDKFYASDNVTGIAITDGTHAFAVMINGVYLRICTGPYSSTTMIQPVVAAKAYYDPSRTTVTSHTLTMAGYQGVIYILIDGELLGTMSSTSGYTAVKGYLSDTTNHNTSNVNLTAIVADILGAGQTAFGYCANMNVAVASNHNNAGYTNTTLTRDEAEVKTLLGL